MEGRSYIPPYQDHFTPSQVANTVTDLAKFHIDLSTMPFSAIGSLTPGGSVGPWINLHFCQVTPPFFFGPFQTVKDQYLAFIDHILQHIEAGQVFIDRAVRPIWRIWR